MIATLEGSKGVSLWERFSAWIVSTENRLYIGWFEYLKRKDNELPITVGQRI